jgi:hypothetical protein
MSWDKRGDLAKVQEQGKAALLEYGEHELAMKQAESDKAMIEGRIAACDRVTSELLQSKPGADSFATPEEIADWQRRVDELQVKRTEYSERCRSLNVIVASERMTLIKLDHWIMTLQRSQRNLQAVVDGRKPDSGFEGGLYRV